MRQFTGVIRYGAVPLLLLLSLALPYVAGPVSAYLESLLLVLIVAWHFTQPAPMTDDLGGNLAALAVLLLLVIFAITNPPGRSDYLFALNFAIFLFLTPAFAALSRFAASVNLLHVARLALLGAFLALLFAAWQRFVSGNPRPSGLGLLAIPSTAAALVLGFLGGLGAIQSKRATRWAYLAGPVIGVAVVLISDSRGPLLAVPPMTAVLLFFLVRSRLAFTAVLIGAAFVVAAVFALSGSHLARFSTIPSAVWSVLTNQELPHSSDVKRLILFRTSISAFLESPWIGHGWGEKTTVVQRLSGGYFHFSNRNQNHLHSDILNFGVAGGIAGLLAYAMLITAPLVSALRSVRDSQYAGRVAGTLLIVCGFVASGLTNLVLGFEYLTTLYACLAAILVGYCRDAPIKPMVSAVA